jgi:steroid delta-isomerase-like uncharacterized protein
MSAESNVALIRRFFDEVCNGRKLELADQMFTADHAYHDPSTPAAPGPQGVKDVIGTYQRAYADAKWTVHEVIAAGEDRVIVRWTGSGTNSSELMGIPATGKKVKVDGLWMARFSGGRIAEMWNCWDTLGMLQQLGVVPALEARK